MTRVFGRAIPGTPNVALRDDALATLLADAAGHLLLGTAADALELLEVQPPGGRAMAAAEYLRGHPL